MEVDKWSVSNDLSSKENPPQKYGLPENYNSKDHEPVRMRHNGYNTGDKSETQRKRRSKNRLSLRKSTGFVSSDIVDEALRMGDQNNTDDVV